jgi:hypothetical protein
VASCRCLVLGRPPPARHLLPDRRPPPLGLRRKGRFQGLTPRQRHPTAIGSKHRIASRLPLRGQLGLHVFPQVRHDGTEQFGLPFAQHLQKPLRAYAWGWLPTKHFLDELTGLGKAGLQRIQFRRGPHQSGGRQQPGFPRRPLSPRPARKYRRREQPIDHLLKGLRIDNQREWVVLVRHPTLLGSGWDSADCTTHAVGWHAYDSGKSLSHQDFFPFPGKVGYRRSVPPL